MFSYTYLTSYKCWKIIIIRGTWKKKEEEESKI